MISVFYKSDKLTLDKFATEIKNTHLINYNHCREIGSNKIQLHEYVKTSGGMYLIESAGGNLYLNEAAASIGLKAKSPLITDIKLKARLDCSEFGISQILEMRLNFGEHYKIYKYRRDYENLPFFNIWRLKYKRNNKTAIIIMGDKRDYKEIVELELDV